MRAIYGINTGFCRGIEGDTRSLDDHSHDMPRGNAWTWNPYRTVRSSHIRSFIISVYPNVPQIPILARPVPLVIPLRKRSYGQNCLVESLSPGPIVDSEANSLPSVSLNWTRLSHSK